MRDNLLQAFSQLLANLSDEEAFNLINARLETAQQYHDRLEKQAPDLNSYGEFARPGE